MKTVTIASEKEFHFSEEEGRHIFFTSDTHFHHDNIIRLCNCPFRDIHEMDEKLIENWNSAVGEDNNGYRPIPFEQVKRIIGKQMTVKSAI